jgi:hypothetical protein
MIVRRKEWTYRTHDALMAKSIVFSRPVTRQYVIDYVLRNFNKLIVEIWAL